jgi:hypothetical protein
MIHLALPRLTFADALIGAGSATLTAFQLRGEQEPGRTLRVGNKGASDAD